MHIMKDNVLQSTQTEFRSDTPMTLRNWNRRTYCILITWCVCQHALCLWAPPHLPAIQRLLIKTPSMFDEGLSDSVSYAAVMGSLRLTRWHLDSRLSPSSSSFVLHLSVNDLRARHEHEDRSRTKTAVCVYSAVIRRNPWSDTCSDYEVWFMYQRLVRIT